MNELQFLEKIEEMREQGLCNTSPDSAKRYAAQLRAGSDLSLTVAEEGVEICQPGQAILDLEAPEQLEKLDQWQGVTLLSDRERAAIKLFLKMHGITPITKKSALQAELAQEEVKNAERSQNGGMTNSKRLGGADSGENLRREEPPLSLYGLLVALRQSTKNRRSSEGEPSYTLLMRALLLNDQYYWSSDSTERHLRRWGGNYYEYAQVILANVHNEQRRVQVKEKMLQALHTLEDGTMGPELRLDVARACVSLEEAMERWKVNQENPEEEWGRYEGSEAQLVLQQLASMHKGTISHIYKNITDEDLVELVVKLFSLAIDASEGRFPPAPDPEDRVEKLTPGEKALLAVLTCGLPLKRKHWLMEEIQPMLMNILLAGVLVPQKGVGRYDQLVLAEGIKPVKRTKIMEGMIRDRLFRDERIIRDKNVYVSLTEALQSETFCGKDRDCVWKLLSQLLAKNDAEDIKTEDQWSLTEQLEPILEHVSGNEQMVLLDFLVRCHWGRLGLENDLVVIESVDKLLLWMENYPAEMEQIWKKILPGTSIEKSAEALYRTGGSLIHAELHSICASRCLSRATEFWGSELFWACEAALQAERALVQLRALYAPVLAIQAARTKAMAYAMLGNRKACEEALKEAERWNEENTLDYFLDEEPLEPTRGACEEQLSRWKEPKPLDPRFYGWMMEERSYDMDLVRRIVMRALDCEKLTESMLLFCILVWEEIPPNSRIVGWHKLARKMAEMHILVRDHPRSDANVICNYLINRNVLDFGTLGMDNAWRLKTITEELNRKYEDEKE